MPTIAVNSGTICPPKATNPTIRCYAFVLLSQEVIKPEGRTATLLKIRYRGIVKIIQNILKRSIKDE